MLIRFGVQNYRSIRDRQELSMVAAPLQDSQADLLSPATFRHSLLPAAVIYGANASGKSTILSALNFLRGAVASSHKEVDRAKAIPRIPFALDDSSAERESTFDIEFIRDGIRYAYGFSCLDDRFTKEWLYAYPKGTQQIWFERVDGEETYFGKGLKGQLRTIERLTRPGALFLSVATQYNNEQIEVISSYISSISLKANFVSRTPKAELLHKYRQDIVDFLSLADTGVTDLSIDEVMPDDEHKTFENRIREAILGAIPSERVQFQQSPNVDLSLTHRGVGSISRALPFSEESHGTVKSIFLLPSVYRALHEGSILLVDELDASLHTVLAEKIISLFNDKDTNPRGAQIIATTHDTNLLVGDVLRRDQVWFTEKSSDGNTVLYPLTDIKTRNTDNLERGYLEGRFGAIPMRTSVRRFRSKIAQ